MIVRGTTPYHSFLIPLAKEDITMIYITYLQNGEVVLDKSIDDIDIEDLFADDTDEIVSGCKATLHLTQEDTLKFKFYPAEEKNVAMIQTRILTSDGEAHASDIILERIYGVLKDEVITENESENKNDVEL